MDLSGKISCPNCQFFAFKEDLERSCGNCFACLGCEIYTCPECNADIVVKPLPDRKQMGPAR